MGTIWHAAALWVLLLVVVAVSPLGVYLVQLLARWLSGRRREPGAAGPLPRR